MFNNILLHTRDALDASAACATVKFDTATINDYPWENDLSSFNCGHVTVTFDLLKLECRYAEYLRHRLSSVTALSCDSKPHRQTFHQNVNYIIAASLRVTLRTRI